MRAVIGELGIRPGHDLDRVLDYASQIHRLRTKLDQHAVSRSSLLYAALRTEPLVRAVLETNGLRVNMFEGRLSFNTTPQLERRQEPVDFGVNPDTTTKALYDYRSEWGERPLDSLGLAAVLLKNAGGNLLRHLRSSGLDVDDAVVRLRTYVQASTFDGYIRTRETGFELSGLAGSVLVAAERMLFRHDIAFPPITTSLVLIAAFDAHRAEPGTALDMFRQYVVDHVGEERLSQAIDEWTSWYARGRNSSGDTPITPPLAAVFERARQIAETASGSEIIQARHLVGAFIAMARGDGDDGASEFLATLDIDREALAAAFYGWLEQHAPAAGGDQLPVWRRFIGLREPAYLARFDAEHNAGEDWLNIDDHVQAFATMIASDRITPPLAVGLFGDWGSGKSFFMAKLRDAVRERAARAQSREGTPYHSRIVQIEFNAWHYVESNLWASLVENVFSNLKLTTETESDEKKIAERRIELAKKIDALVADRAAAEEKLQKAEVERTFAAHALEAKQKLAETSAAGLRELRAVDAWALVEIEPEARKKLQTELDKLGLGAALTSKEEVRKTFDDLRATAKRTEITRTWVMRRPVTLGVLVLIILLAPLTAATLAERLQTLNIDLNPVLAQILTPLAAALAWIAARLKTVNNIFDRIDDARQSIDRALEAKESERLRDIAEADQKLKAAVQEVESAKTELDAKESEVATAKRELIELSRGRRLARFINDRAESDDYRKLLGVLATVRHDFSTLSALMQPEEGESTLPEEYRIDRIILYIDDLDRCDPHRVVEVLQAVHLLLAFRLFVVVVGVDARWVAKSLRHEHRVLRDHFDDPDDMDMDVMGFGVKPHDYLEKIFQVPFWLEPLTAETTASYIGQLLVDDVAEKSRVASTPALVPPANSRAATAAAAPSATAVEAKRKRRRVDADPKQLEIDPLELSFMQSKAISALVSRSPRTAKRFVNTYRFYRAGIAPYDLPAYLADGTVRRYEAVLTLLAIVVGAQDVSLEVFDAMKNPEHAHLTLAQLATVLDHTFAEHHDQDEWTLVAAALRAVSRGKETVAAIRAYIDDVARYSFRPPFKERRRKKRAPIAIRIEPGGKEKGDPLPDRLSP